MKVGSSVLGVVLSPSRCCSSRSGVMHRGGETLILQLNEFPALHLSHYVPGQCRKQNELPASPVFSALTNPPCPAPSPEKLLSTQMPRPCLERAFGMDAESCQMILMGNRLGSHDIRPHPASLSPSADPVCPRQRDSPLFK